MAKKKNKKPVPPEVKLQRKIKKTIRRTTFLAVIVAGYFWVLPLVVPSLSPQINNTKGNLVFVAGKAQTSISQILGTATQLTSMVGSKNQEQKKGVEALVQDTVDDLTQRIKELPGEQVKKVKTQFCADLIEEAVLSCQATESANNEE